MKLLAKTAEERYQTAIGVEYDLRRCLDAVETSSSSSDSTVLAAPLGKIAFAEQGGQKVVQYTPSS